jgi:ribosomal protein L11
MNCRIKVNPDRSYNLHIDNPSSMFYLKQAAGLERGKMIGKISKGCTIKKNLI